MQADLKERFNVTYESGAAASLLAFEAAGAEKSIGFQVEMIAANKIPFILPLETKSMNGRLTFNFDVTSKLSLSYYLRHRKLNRSEFLAIVYSITRALLECGSYLLDSRSFMLDGEYIFINPATLEISLVYLPVILERDINNELKEYLIDLILNLADLDESEGDNYIQRILGCLKAQAFNIQDLNGLLRQLVGAAGQSGGSYGQACTEEAQAPEWSPTAEKEAANELMPAGKTQKSGNEGEAGKAVFQRIFSKGVLSMLVPQLLLVGGALAAFHYINIAAKPRASSYGAVVLTAVAFEVLLLKALFSSKAGSAGSEVRENSPAKSNKTVNDKSVLESPANGAFVMRTPPVNPGEDEAWSRGDTEILAVRDKADHPVLKGQQGGEEIHITANNFIIGRFGGKVNHTVVNSAIGKMHAQIIIQGDSCLIRDLNSKNGTFINGARLIPNIDYPLQDNDTVTLANIDYSFLTCKSAAESSHSQAINGSCFSPEALSKPL